MPAITAAASKRVSSLTELNRWLREHGGAGALHAEAVDILGEHAALFESGEFPDTVRIGDQAVPVAYAYAPGEDQDGVTLRLNVPLASVVDPEKLEWAVPSLRAERVAQLLRLLPKALRRPLMPLPATARAIIEAIPPDSDSFLEGMTHFIRQRYGIEIPRSAWSVEALPPHLRPRFEILGAESGAPLVGRDLAEPGAAITARGSHAVRVVASRGQPVGAVRSHGLGFRGRAGVLRGG